MMESLPETNAVSVAYWTLIFRLFGVIVEVERFEHTVKPLYKNVV